MTGLGIQVWGLLLNGLRIGSWHSNVMELLEVLRVLGHSYRLASMGGGSGVVFSRFTLAFCTTLVAATVCKLAWQRPALQAFRGVRIRKRCRASEDELRPHDSIVRSRKKLMTGSPIIYWGQLIPKGVIHEIRHNRTSCCRCIFEHGRFRADKVGSESPARQDRNGSAATEQRQSERQRRWPNYIERHWQFAIRRLWRRNKQPQLSQLALFAAWP